MSFSCKHIAFLFFLTWGFIFTPLQAQFIHFSMSVEPELSVQVLQELNFGTVVANSGVQKIGRESSKKGIFRIRALRNQQVLITLDKPANLIHSDPEIEDRIPLSLEASYTSHVQNIQLSVPFSGNTAWFSVGSESQDNQTVTWETAYIYIYGDVTVGRVREGNYSGSLVLNVEYY